MKFTIETRPTTEKRDGKTGFMTDIHADLNGASFEELIGLLAYLGSDATKKALEHFEKSGDNGNIIKIAKDFSAARNEMITNIKGVIAKRLIEEVAAVIEKRSSANGKPARKPASRKPSAKAKKEGK